ncbi:MAG: hypothetical protein CSA81_13255 [Acidobacteria bacterium]|nr:MAG: hypothetical protein CSA81_13255 [Acidobacteriota bacterium]
MKDIQWFSFDPVDTLFFRGAEPMAMGESHTATSLFPPPVRTLSGALRTAVLKQNGISIKRFYENDFGRKQGEQQVLETIGKAGDDAQNTPFQIIGPLLYEGSTVYMPAPLAWVADRSAVEKLSDKGVCELETQWMSSETSPLVPWPRQFTWARRSGYQTLEHFWTPVKTYPGSGAARLHVRHQNSFYSEEVRTGIALENRRNVRHGHLYSFKHHRLHAGVRILFGSTRPLPLADRGLLFVGAEQRFGQYQILKTEITLPTTPSQYEVALGPIECSLINHKDVFATSKPLKFGGWDLKKGFHKPLTSHYPPGTVFQHNQISNTLAI